MITRAMVKAGYAAGLITLIKSPNDDGVACSIGDCWFYFGGMTAEESTVEVYRECVPEDDIVEEIYTALDAFRTAGCEECKDEYLYYKYFLTEHGIS